MRRICRVIAGLLTMLIGGGAVLGGSQLWNGAPPTWTDIVAGDGAVRFTARAVVVLGAVLVAGGLAAALGSRRGMAIAAIAVGVFAVAGFVMNRVLYGDVRVVHAGSNVVVAAIILGLLWAGRTRPAASPEPSS